MLPYNRHHVLSMLDLNNGLCQYGEQSLRLV